MFCPNFLPSCTALQHKARHCVFAEVSDNFTNTDSKCCCKNHLRLYIKIGETMQKVVQACFSRRNWSGYSARVLPEHLVCEGKLLVAGRC